MHNLKQIAAGVLAVGTFLSGLRLFANDAAGYDAQIPALADEIIAAQCGGQDVQSWLDSTLTAKVGNSAPDWYAMALSHQGYDMSAYAAALENYIAANEIPSPTSRERMALALCACKTPAPACCTELLDASAGQLGVMSWVFALHLLNNGVESAQYSPDEVAAILVDAQLADGGWAVNGKFGDVDVTAMTIQALAACRNVQGVADAVDNGIEFLANAQLSDGGYQSWGTPNPESTAQVWVALSALGIDPLTDERFIKDGTVLDGLLQYRVGEGQYSHTLNGDANQMATVQTYLAFHAAELCENGGNAFFLFDYEVPAPQETTTAPVTKATKQTTASAGTQTAESSGTSAKSETETTTGKTHKTDADTSKTVKSTTTGKTSQLTSETSLSGAISSQSAQSTETVNTNVTAVQSVKRYAYRVPATIIALTIFLVVAVICLIRKKRSYKTYVTIAGAAGVAVLLIWTLRIESKSQYYTKTEHSGGGTVTMAIRCDVICGLPGSEAYPADGVILPETTFTIEENENALTLLYDAVRANELQIEVDGVSNDVLETAYVRGIANLYEFDFGDLSGWTYTVNGERPPIGCGAFTLHDGDAVVWAYTVNL